MCPVGLLAGGDKLAAINGNNKLATTVKQQQSHRVHTHHPSTVEAVLHGEVGNQHTAHVVSPEGRAHGLVGWVPVTAELAEPERLCPGVLPAKLRAPLVEPLIRGAACPNPRFDLQVVIPYFGEAANYGAIPTITISSLGKNAGTIFELGVLCGPTGFGALDICITEKLAHARCGSTPRDFREYLLMGQAKADAMCRTRIGYD